MRARGAALAMLLLLPVAGLAGEAVTVIQPWARASIMASRPGAAYLAIESPADDRLTAVGTPVADEVLIHAVEEENGVRRMVHLPDLDLPAGQPVTLAPGVTHLMLIGLHEKLAEGGSFPMTLRFEHAPDITVEVPVLGIAAQGPQEELQ